MAKRGGSPGRVCTYLTGSEGLVDWFIERAVGSRGCLQDAGIGFEGGEGRIVLEVGLFGHDEVVVV